MDYKVASDYSARVHFEGFGEFERRLQITPTIAGWRHLSFRVYALRQGQVLGGESASDEMVMVLLTGRMTLEAAGGRWELQGRTTVFQGQPYLLYLPPGHAYHLTVHTHCDVAYSRAPAEGRLLPRLIRPEEVRTEIRNDAGGAYRLHHLLGAGDAEKLVCAEVVTTGRCSLPYPPYADGMNSRQAGAHFEAVRYCRFDPKDARGTQRLCGNDGTPDQTFPVCDGDAVIVRQAYPPMAAPPGCSVYCLDFATGAVPAPADRQEA